jgi:hypothetical protein
MKKKKLMENDANEQEKYLKKNYVLTPHFI